LRWLMSSVSLVLVFYVLCDISWGWGLWLVDDAEFVLLV
jgi:hypothetical protein